MKPILVHCHIYYPEMWAELKACIHNIKPHPFKLFVTMIEKRIDIWEDILVDFPDAHIEIVANCGFDIGPFIHIINQVNLDEYSYIVKLHSKRNIVTNKPLFRNMTDSKWRDALLSFIRTPEIFDQCLKGVDENPLIGMHANHTIIVYHDFYDKKTKKRMKQYMKEHHYPKHKYAFVAGTMFIAKADIFKDIQNLRLSLTDFPETKGKHKAQLAHIIERLLGYFVYKNGLVIRDTLIEPEIEQKYHQKEYINMKFIYPIKRFFYQKKITKSGNVLIKIFKIPIFLKKK